MARLVDTKLNGTNLTVEMDQLEYSGSRGMRFKLYRILYDGSKTLVSTADSSNNGGEANVTFDVSSVPPGNTEFVIMRYMFESGREFIVGYSFHEYIREKVTPQPEPDPTPRARPMSGYVIDEIVTATDRSVTVRITVNGYGEVNIMSRTFEQEGYGYALDYIEIDPDDYYLRTSGRKTFELSYRLNGWLEDRFSMSGDTGLPLGTIKITFIADGFYREKYILCLNTYFFTIYDRYGGYPTSLAYSPLGYSMVVTPLDTIYTEWKLLINIFYYLSSATEGALKMGRRADYIPQRGDVITADMYNGLLDIANSCWNGLKKRYGWDAYNLKITIPNRVYSGQIIPKDFIQTLGHAANEMSMFMQKVTNRGIEGNWVY